MDEFSLSIKSGLSDDIVTDLSVTINFPLLIERSLRIIEEAATKQQPGNRKFPRIFQSIKEKIQKFSIYLY